MNEDTKAKFELAIGLCERSQFDEARTILDDVLKEAPDNSEAWRLAAQVDWMHTGDVDKAYDELIESLKLDPKNKWALLLMGNLLSKGKKDMNSAKEYYNKVLEYNPKDIVAINNVAGIMMQNDKFDDAIELFKRALKIDNTFANSYYGIALSYYKKGDIQSAFEYCHQGALKSVKAPENPGVREQLLKLYVHCAEELDKQTNYPRIWHKIKQKLEVLGNAPIVFQQDSNLQVYAKVEYGPTYGRKEHIVKYNPQKEYVSHLFVHEMMHLEMLIADSRTGGGKVFVTTDSDKKAFRKKFYTFFRKKYQDLGTEGIEATFNQALSGISLQVMNCPLDLFVEDKIYNEYPEMRPVQLLSLMRMERENIESANSKRVHNSFPREITRDNKVMNMCSSWHFKQLYGYDLINQYHPTRDEYNQAKDLYDEYCAYIDTFKTGDEYELLEYFADSLQFPYYTLMDEDEYRRFKFKGKEDRVSLDFTNDKGMDADDVDVANAKFALDHQDGSDTTETTMMALHMLSALEFFDGMSKADVKSIAIEIAMVGVNGIDPHSKYTLKSIPNKEFSGYKLLAYYYVSWAIAIPEMLEQLQLPFSKAYDIAKALYAKGERNKDD